MIPFFVADRPMSLRLLAWSFSRAPQVEVGLLTHAHVSPAFRQLFAAFPHRSWDAAENELPLPVRVRRIGDSGIFHGTLSNEELFARYGQLGAEFGIMSDVIGDAEATVASARLAVREYRRKRRMFELVLVAQGTTLDEYLRCYSSLAKLGPFKIAIGGLLRRRLASVRYLHVGSETQMVAVLDAIRRHFDPAWSFVLGAYHPARHQMLAQKGVFGSDYKGWIFQYTHRRDALMRAANECLAEKGLSEELRALLSRRQVAAQRESEARREYARTKNIDHASRSAKQRCRKSWQRALTALGGIDERLMEVRRRPRTRTSVAALESLAQLLTSSERDVRFEGVHQYLMRRVYSQCLEDLERVANI